MSAGVIADSYVAASAPAASYADMVLADSPYAALLAGRSTGSPQDSSGNGNHFTRLDGAIIRPLLTTERGLYSGGSGASASRAIPTGLASGQNTVSFWIDVPTLDSCGAFYSIGAGGNGFALGISGSASNFTTPGKVLIILRAGVAFTNTGYSFTPGRRHVMISRSSAATPVYTVYVDGASVYSSALSTTAATTGIYLGGVNTGNPMLPGLALHRIAFFTTTLAASRATAHFNSGTPADAPILADGPTIYATLSDQIAGLDDATGSRQNLGFVGTPPTQVTGPSAQIPGWSWTTSAGYAIGADVVAQPTTMTYECWINYASNPAADTPIMAFGGSPAIGITSGLILTTAGKISLAAYNSGASPQSTPITDPNVLTPNVWHHVVGSIGADGMKLRIDKTTVATTPNPTGVSSLTSSRLYIRNAGPNSASGTGAVQIAAPVFTRSQLSDAQTDAHYNAA